MDGWVNKHEFVLLAQETTFHFLFETKSHHLFFFLSCFFVHDLPTALTACSSLWLCQRRSSNLNETLSLDHHLSLNLPKSLLRLNPTKPWPFHKLKPRVYYCNRDGEGSVRLPPWGHCIMRRFYGWGQTTYMLARDGGLAMSELSVKTVGIFLRLPFQTFKCHCKPWLCSLCPASLSAFTNTLHLVRSKAAQIWISKQNVNKLNSVYWLSPAKKKEKVENITVCVCVCARLLLVCSSVSCFLQDNLPVTYYIYSLFTYWSQQYTFS